MKGAVLGGSGTWWTGQSFGSSGGGQEAAQLLVHDAHLAHSRRHFSFSFLDDKWDMFMGHLMCLSSVHSAS